ncbi:MAG: hypothetical protein IJE23_07300, partial [Tyzzerella sp.]|nr:hypothetical protein [Tyzzerella sp.]
ITVTFPNETYYMLSKVCFTTNGAYGIPEDFTVSVWDGTEWVVVAEETGYNISGEWSKEITPIIGNKIQLHATKLGFAQGSTTKRVLQLREMEAYGTPVVNVANGGSATITTYSEISSWASTYDPNVRLINGAKTGSSEFGTSKFYKDGSPYHTESAIVTFAGGAYSEIDKIILFPAINGSSYIGGFPVDFTVSVWDGSKWVQVAEKTEYASGIKGLSIEVDSIECNAVKVEATKLSVSSDGTNYALQLSEIEAWGTQVDFLTNKEAYASGNTAQLTWKEKKVENFKAEIQMLDYTKGTTGYGLYFGQSDYGVVEDGVISVTPNSTNVGGISVGGTAQLDVSTAAYVDSSISSITYFNKNASGNQVRSSHDVAGYSEGTYDKLHTLNVEVIDGILKVWWTGHEAEAWTIDISEEYQGGYVSLYSSGNDKGGIKSFTVYEILDEDINTNIDMNVEIVGSYTVVTVNNDIAKGVLKNSTLKGNLKFDSEKFNYCTTVIEDVSADRHDNVVGTVMNGGVSIDMTSYSANANAKFYFKNNADELDFTGFTFDVESITRVNKETASATTTESVKYDYTGDDGALDKLIDARDLVRAAKEDKVPEDVRNAMVGIHDDSDWVTGVTGEVKDTVYVDAANGSYTGDGSAESPLSSLTLASYRVANGGTINIVGTYALDSEESTIGMGEKSITIASSDGVLDLTSIDTMEVCGDVTLQGITVKADNDIVYANGHTFLVESSVVVDGYIGEIYGGNNGEMPLESTNLNMQAGNYNIIYGGSRSVSTIIGDTHVTIGGTVNNNRTDFDVTDHTYNEIVCLYGGSRNGLVKGNTNVTVEGNAQTSYAHGGGWGATSEVLGTCNVYGQGGKLSGYYGGSLGGKVYATNVEMTGGEVEQIFGGSWVGSYEEWNASITGSTTVTFTGGKVTRRIFAGCYNDNSSDGNIVTGTSTLNIGGNANFSHSFGYDYQLCAGSRYSTSSDAENSVLNITKDKNSAYSSYITNGYYGHSDIINVVETLP